MTLLPGSPKRAITFKGNLVTTVYGGIGAGTREGGRKHAIGFPAEAKHLCGWSGVLVACVGWSGGVFVQCREVLVAGDKASGDILNLDNICQFSTRNTTQGKC